MKLLVTGGAGLIGFETCKQLAQMGHDVHLMDLGEQIQRLKDPLPQNIKVFYGSVLDTSSIRDAMRGCKITLHFAALLGVQRSEKEKLKCLDININGTKNILDCAVQEKVEKIVFASSSEVYGEPLKNPITEDFITQGKTVYAVSKLTGEELCKAYHQKYALDYTLLRYFNCYGPYQTSQFVISKFINNVLENKSPVINGDGKQVRSYTFVSDTVKATLLAAFSKQTSQEILNIGNGEQPISLTDLAKLTIKLSGKKNLKPVYQQDFKNCDRNSDREIYSRFCDSSKAKKILKWEAEVSLEEGIKKVMESGTIYKRWANVYDEY